VIYQGAGRQDENLEDWHPFFQDLQLRLEGLEEGIDKSLNIC
jgi:hypothetical protein